MGPSMGSAPSVSRLLVWEMRTVLRLRAKAEKRKNFENATQSSGLDCGPSSHEHARRVADAGSTVLFEVNCGEAIK